MPLKARLAKYEERAGLKSLLIIKQLQKVFVWSLLITPNVEQDVSFLQLLRTILWGFRAQACTQIGFVFNTQLIAVENILMHT